MVDSVGVPVAERSSEVAARVAAVPVVVDKAVMAAKAVRALVGAVRMLRDRVVTLGT